MTKTIRGLSVRQPWASMIAEGKKTIEVRTWWTRYRGLIAIVAGQTPDRDAIAVHGFEDAPRGAIVAVAELVDVRLFTEEDADAACVPYSESKYAWVIEDVAALVPGVPYRGAQGLFTIRRSVLRGFL